MCEQTARELPGSPASASAARRFVLEQCDAWGLGGLCADLTLPVSELVTNAVLHARSPTTVTISLTAAFVEVSIRDSSSRTPVMRPVRADLEQDIRAVAARLSQLPDDLRDEALHVGEAGSIAAGRGLHIVAAVADEWGVSGLASGKDVWFRIATSSGWTPPRPCRCRSEPAATSPGGMPLHVPT